jgi:uncharacterized membrane protein
MSAPTPAPAQPRAPMRPGRRVLSAALFTLCVLYGLWFHDDKHLAAVIIVFILPPLLLLLGVLRGNAKAAFWAGTLGLFWFAHAVMVAWSRPDERSLAFAGIVLSVVIVFSASLPGLSARFGKRRA